MKRTITAIAAALLLTSCSAPAEPTQPAAEPESMTAPAPGSPESMAADSGAILPGKYSEGKFEFTSINGGSGVIEIPAEAPADLAELDTAETSFMAVDVDNRKGSENINMYSVNLYDEAGVEYAYQRETSWMDYEVPEHGVSTDVYNSYLDNVSPGERKTVYMVGPTVPEEFVAVMVEPTGMMEEPVQAELVK